MNRIARADVLNEESVVHDFGRRCWMQLWLIVGLMTITWFRVVMLRHALAAHRTRERFEATRCAVCSARDAAPGRSPPAPAENDNQEPSPACGSCASAPMSRGAHAARVAAALAASDFPFCLRALPSPPNLERQLAVRRPVRQQTSIIFLPASFGGVSQVVQGEEWAAAERELRMTLGRDNIDLRVNWPGDVDDVGRYLMQAEHDVVHISGRTPCWGLVPPPRQPVHRDLSASRKEPATSPGVPRALATMIRSAAPSVRVVVLNGCYTDALPTSSVQRWTAFSA